jgi:DNA-binding Lrp family transcriptional regulator
MSLDEIDARIVTALIKDARASYAVIGNEVGLSAPAVKRRVDRLRASGAITGFSARVDPAALGWTTEAYVELFCRVSTTPEEIRAAVRRHPEVADACTVTGEADALVHIRAADIRHFEQVVERIAAEPFVQRTRSVIVLSRLVERADSIAPHIRLSAGSVCPMPETNTDPSADTARFQAFKDRSDDLPPAWQMKANSSKIGLLAGIVVVVAIFAAIFGVLLIG